MHKKGDQNNMNTKRKSIKKKERYVIYRRYHGTCQICGSKFPYEEMTIDHIIPLEAGGKNVLENYQCTCKICNRMKGSMLQDEFYMHITETFWYLTGKKCGNEFAEKLFYLIQNT